MTNNISLLYIDEKTGGFQSFLSTEPIPKMTCHDGLVSLFVCYMTIFNAGWQAVRNIEEISSYCHQLKKKSLPLWQLICLIVSVNTSAHADKHAVTAIKKCLNICIISPFKSQYPIVPKPTVSYILYVEVLYNVGSSGLNHYKTKSNRCHNR